mgnify:CR=1 FL=1
MKKSITMFLVASLLWACNSNPSSDTETETHAQSEDHAHDAMLTLNNGQKWKADAPTNENVVDIRTIVQNFSAEPHTSLADYQIVADDLQKGLNKMVQECKMQGPDHDALHLWLEPLLKAVNELKKADDTASAEKIFHDIDERLQLYPQYFE